MREEGTTIAEIALMLGRTESSVWAKLKRERRPSPLEKLPLQKSSVSRALDPLGTWRKHKAKSLGIPAYHIFDNKTKGFIEEARPTSFDELLLVKGIGWHTAKTYGKEILEIVNENNNKWISDIDNRIKSIEDIILNCLIFPKGGPPSNPKDWDKLSEEERYRLLESRGARKKEIKEKMKFNKLNCIDKIIMGVLKDEYILYDLDKVYGTAQKYEVISAGEKQDKIFAVREITEKGREITEKGSMLGNMGYQCDNKTCNHRVQANFLASVKCPKCGETSLQKV